LANAKATKYVSAEYEDVKVTLFGDTAIAKGGFKGKGTDASGKPMDVHERWTDTWVKMPNGKWQCVATQGSTNTNISERTKLNAVATCAYRKLRPI
jgi:ketosteroid isomerase-like protein